MVGGCSVGNRVASRKFRASKPASSVSGVAELRIASGFPLSGTCRGVGVASRRMGRNASKTMNKEEIFSAWAPDESPWSRWAKPVLFAHLDSALSHIPVTETAGDVGWAPVPGEKAALAL